MRRVFADSLYWIAIANLKDHWHATAVRASQSLGGVEIVTTEEILNEFLTAFRHNAALRLAATRTTENVRNDPAVLIRPQTHQSFLDGYALYKARPDKEYSLTDCISMSAMVDESITEVLTHDKHFVQEGFTLLL